MDVIRSLLVIYFLLIFSVLFAQKEEVQGTFRGNYFSIKDFGSSNQIWTGTQGPFGTVLFGNDQEILAFNGIKWSKIQTDASTSKKIESQIYKTKVSKLLSSKSGIVYVGRENNFGYLDFDPIGKLVYKPLITDFQKKRLGQIWSMFEDESGIIWVIGKNSIYTIEPNFKVTEILLPEKLADFTCKTAGKTQAGILLIYSGDQSDKKRLFGFLNFNSKQFNWINLSDDLHLTNLRGTAFIQGKTYLFDYNKTVFTIDSKQKITKIDASHPLHSFFQSHQPSVVKLYNKQLYVGTETEGAFILDFNGKILRRFDLEEGMENNNVFDLFLDETNNLWLNLDEGIHFFETSSPITTIGKPQGISASIQAIDFKSGQPILALNTDLFLSKNTQGRSSFYNSQTIQETTFDVKTFEIDWRKRTLVVGYEGIYEFDNFQKKSVVNEYAWTIFQNPKQKNQLFVGLEAGLGILTWMKNKWNYEVLPHELAGDIIHFSSDGNRLYFGIKGEGLGMLLLSNFDFSVLKYPQQLDQNSHVYVEVFQDQILVGSNYGLFYLDKVKNKLIPFPTVNKTQFSGKKEIQIHRLFNDQNEKLWMVYYIEKSKDEFEIETGWFSRKNNEWTWNQGALKTIQKGGILFAIQRLNQNEIWLGSDNGLYILNENSQEKLTQKFKVVIDGIWLNRDLTIHVTQKSSALQKIDYEKNSIDFSFYAATFQTGGSMLYRYRLLGFTDEWSDWSPVARVSFPKLYEGNYQFEVQAQSAFGFISETERFSFQISPPWYRTWWMYLIYFIALVLFILVIIRLSILRIKQQNLRLEKIVTERTLEIALQNEQLEEQKEEITQKSNDILDSINYAKRIQNTILPSNEEFASIQLSPVVFYRPKDIVSGDFYWVQKQENSIYFAAVDCTGHGVPGALVSIVGYNALMRIVTEHALLFPNQILDQLRDLVLDAFRGKGQEEIKDGMDISLCRLDFESQKLHFSGAYNGCVVIRNEEIIELKADKQPIGQFENAFSFSIQTIDVQENDMIYVFTDGFVDQFGGEKGKKLKSKGFKDLLIQASAMNVSQQQELFASFFDSWKADYEQLDDVCVFGVRV